MSTPDPKQPVEQQEPDELRVDDLNPQRVEPEAADDVKGGGSEFVITKHTDSASPSFFKN